MPVLNILPQPYRWTVRRRVQQLTKPLRGHYALGTIPPVGYCYIRKNACSVFTRIMVENAPEPRGADEKAFAFMERCCRLRYRDLAGSGRMIFVIRDPLDRIVSGFIQQVVNRALGPYPELEDSVQALTARSRAELSFADFVTRYLGSEDFARINVHFTPQIAHLAPILYTDVLETRGLAADAARVFGPATAARYFHEPVNAMSQIARHHDPEAWQIPAGELRRRLEATGALPERADLLTPQLRERLAGIYAGDVALFARYRELRAADPARPPALDLRDHDFTAHYALNPRRGRR